MSTELTEEPGNNTHTFIWKTPSITNESKLLICQGFSRTYSEQYIIDPIVELFVMYYSEDMFTLNDIKQSIPEQSFVSPPFVINDIKLYLELFPKGFNIYNQGYVILLLRIPSRGTPSTISRIVTKFWIHLDETDTKHTAMHDFKLYPYSIWDQHALLFTEIQHLDSLTFKVDINTPDIYDNDSVLLPKPLSPIPLYVLPTSEYVWRSSDTETVSCIKNAGNVVCIKSPIFCAYGFKWYMGLWPNGSREQRKGRLNLYLNLVSGLASNIKVVVQFILTFVEYNATEPCVHSFVTDSNSWGIITLDHWPETKDIQSFSTFTFKVCLVVMDVYKDDCVITDKYRDIDTKYPLIHLVDNISLKSFVWNISRDMFNEMKVSKCGTAFYSECFFMYKMKFVICCYPNGIESEEGSVNTMICINALPNEFVVVSTRYNLMVIEAGIEKVGAAAFDVNNLSISWDAGRLSFERIKKWETFTIELDLELIDVMDGDKNITSDFL